MKEQLQSTSSFSQITSLRDSLPTISYSGASAQENSRAEQPRLQELVKQLQNDLITARRDEADARRKSAVADARADELERQLRRQDRHLKDMLSFAKAQREAMDEAKAREEALEEQLRHNSELMTAADAEQNLQVPRLKELLRTAVEREAVLTEQVREMQLAQALTTPAMEQEDCAVVYQEQISSLETQLQEMQQELQQVQQKHQVEVFELKEQLASRAEQVGSATAAEIQDAARKPTARSSLLQPNGAVMKKSETLAQFLAGSRNVSMAQPEQDKFGEVIQELINWEQGEDEQKGLFSVPPQIKASERPGIFSSLRAQAAKEFKHRSELYSIQHVMARIAEILPTYGRERSILQAALCEADVREAQKLYRKLYEETGGSSDDVDRAQAEDGELLLLITDAMLSKLDDGFKAELVGTTSFDRITITRLPARARGFTALALAELHFFPPRWNTMLADFQNLLTMHEPAMLMACSNNLFCQHYETMQVAIQAFEQRHASISAATLLQMLSLQIIMKSSVNHIAEYRKLSTESGSLDKNILSWSEAREKIPQLMEGLMRLERSSPDHNVSRLFSKQRKTLQEVRNTMKSASGSQRVSVFHIQDRDRLDMEPVAALTRLVELTHFQVDKDPECRSCGSRHGAGAGCLKAEALGKAAGRRNSATPANRSDKEAMCSSRSEAT